MKRNLFSKFVLIVFVVGWSLYELYPPTPRNLFDEFRTRAENRDATFTNIVEKVSQLERELPLRTYANLLDGVGTNNITPYFSFVKVPRGKDPTRAILQRLQQDAAGKIRLGLDLQGGTSFLVALGTNTTSVSTNIVAGTNNIAGQTNAVENARLREGLVDQAIEVLRKRVDRFGVAEPIIQPAGENRILIQLPGLSEADKETARTTIKKAAFLEFRIVHPESDELLAQGIGAPLYEKLAETRRDARTGTETYRDYLVKKKAERGLTGAFVTRAFPDYDQFGMPLIILRFDTAGARLFGEITTEHVGHQLAIVLDGELYSAPVINEPIRGGSAQISGNFDIRGAIELANVLENPLDAPLNIEQEYSVEPSLGKDSIRSGVRAALIGTVAVVGFMLVYYLFAGLVANLALMLNIVVLLGVMCGLGSVLTLPGIAGIVLTIGMAVDANVLIFERIREELAAGKSLRGALSAGYDKAFGTIFDSNLTTLIASVILIFMGTGPVKGFGVALTVGVCVSMFTALVVTRLIFDWLLQRGMLKSLPMLHLIRSSKFDFLRLAKPAFVLSWALVLVGVGYGISRGKAVMGVDFAGGDSLTLSFAQKVEVGAVRETVSKLGVGEPTIQYQRDIGAGTELLQVTASFDSADKIEKALKEKYPDAKFREEGVYKVGPTVGREILKTALVAVLLALFGILLYVAFRYEFSFAVGAVVAVVHDIFMTMGWFCLSGREFSAPMVAAILTIIGFSINDTIVIFDRIREDLRLGVRGSFKDVMNIALNQTLSRTIITSGTVFLATMSLYIFGGPVINDFAFTFLVGILTGTYSSVFIACALVLWWHKGERPKLASQVMSDEPGMEREAVPPMKVRPASR